MSSEIERFDGMFLSIAQQSQGIEPLLDNLFSFLRRKTDFYTGATPVMAEELVLKVVRKHSALAEKEDAEKKKLREKEELAKKKKLQEKLKREEEEEKARLKAKAPVEEDVLELSEDGAFDTANAATKEDAVEKPSITPPVVVDADADKQPESVEDDDDSPPPVGNGGKTDKYVWIQQLGELTVTIPVPKGIKTKQLDVQITNRRLKVSIKGQPPIIDGELHKRIIVDDSFWTLEDSDIVINMQKDNKMEWWKCVLIGDAEINTRKVQPENSKLSDLDGETRQTVEKMMFDQRQKALGLPSADELQKREMLNKFMTAHPEMDFSQAKFN